MAEPLTDRPSERAVLAAIAQFGQSAFADVVDLGISLETWTDPAAQALFCCFEHLCNREDNPSLDPGRIYATAQTLKLDGLLGGRNGLEYIRAVRNFPIDEGSVRPLAAKIRKLEIARSLQTQLKEAEKELLSISGEEPAQDILDIAEKRILDFSSMLEQSSRGFHPMHLGARDYIERLMDSPVDSPGIPTGFRRWDEAIGGGIRPNSVDVVAARMKQGKTHFADAVCLYVTSQYQIPCFNVDTELLHEEHLHRILAAMTGLRKRDIETGHCGDDRDGRRKVEEALLRLEKMPYDFESVAGKSSEAILASIRRWFFQRVGFDDNGYLKPCLVVYDYLKLTDSSTLSKNMLEYQALGFLMTALKNLMARYRGRCIALVQMNRDGIDQEHSGVVAGSDRIGWLCTSLSSLRRKTTDEITTDPPGPNGVRYTHSLRPLECRHGPGMDGDDYINLLADYSRGSLVEGPTRRELLSSLPRVQEAGFETEVEDEVDFGN